MARKSRGCAEAYMGTPHKQDRRLTPPRRKRTLSGWKLIIIRRHIMEGCAKIKDSGEKIAFLSVLLYLYES